MKKQPKRAVKPPRIPGWQHKRFPNSLLVDQKPWHTFYWSPVWITITPRRTKK